MKRAGRTVVFAVFLAIFLVGAPAVVLYTAGYRYNPKNGHIVRTGVLAVSSSPRGAHIILDGVDTGDSTPFVFSRITPGTYSVTLTRDGYHSYDDDVTIESGKTSYVSDIALFAANEPMLLTTESAAIITSAPHGNDALVLRRSSGDAEVWQYGIRNRAYTLLANIRTGVDDVLTLRYQAGDDRPLLVNDTAGTFHDILDADTGSLAPTLHAAGLLQLTKSTHAVEVRNTQSPDTLLALLPLADYVIAQTSSQYAVVTGPNEKLYVIDLYAEQPVILSTYATSFAWDTDLGMMVWTDGIEINVFAFANNSTTFVTRQSDTVRDVALSANGHTVFAASATTVQSLTIGGGGTHAMTLATMETVEQCWTANATTNTLYVVGTLNGTRGIYELVLR